MVISDLLQQYIVNALPSSVVWRATRGTGDAVRELVGEAERLPLKDPRFMTVQFGYASNRR
jgi:hypothetical protein